MRTKMLAIFPAALMLILAALACNMPGSANTPSAVSSPVETFTPTVGGLLPATETATPEPVYTSTTEMTETSAPAPTAQDPLVSKAALCWWGPGPVYDVISSLKQDVRVKLVGRGSIPGWLLIENPTYHVPCWVQEGYLQIDPATDFSVLPIFTPPPTPTPTLTPSRTPTP